MRCNKTNTFAMLLGVLIGLAGTVVQGADDDLKIKTVSGPAEVDMDGIAKVGLPAGYEFLNGDSTRTYLEAIGEPTSGEEVGLITPTNADWSVFFEFSAIGYVKDDDKDKLDPDKLLKAIRRGNDEGNKHRVKAGQPPLELVGWEVPPHYDEKTHQLEWAIRATCEGKPILNYNTRLLGRKGVMEAVLVVEPEELQKTMPAFRDLLTTYSFQTGNSYAEFRSGDKVAKYGLAALVLGGTAVGAAKLGLFATLAAFLKKGWKLVVVGIAALAALIKKVFSGRSTR
ncbi:MAG TPA: DUF2167 domain-containing protein [Clostridia bacterium]|nr:DUF2167 domain-containing protein [Clostridia bacterium]